MDEKKPLPGWLYMLLGIAIIAYTRFIQSKQPNTSIGIFFWVGIVFVVIGILREVVQRMAKKKAPVEQVGPPLVRQDLNHPRQHANVSPHMTHQHTQPQMHPSHPYQPLHKQCPRCHSLTPGQGKFCHNCGFQFF